MTRILTAAIAGLLIATSHAAAQQGGPRISTITVQGEGRAEVAPDHARLTVEIVTKGKTAGAASNAHRERAGKGAELLRGMENDGLKIERSTFRLNHFRQPVPAGQKAPEPEYQAVTSFALKSTQLDKIDQLVTAIAESGLFEVQNLRFGIDDNNPGIAAARRDAIADARERAKTYAEAAGVQVGEVIEITDTSPRVLRDMAAPMAMRASAGASMEVSPPDVIPLNTTITVTWRLVPGQ